LNDNVDHKTAGIDHKIAGTDERLDRLEQKMQGLEAAVVEIKDLILAGHSAASSIHHAAA